MNLKTAIAILASMITSASYANLPLKIEDLNAYENKFKLDFGINYFNQSKSSFKNKGFDWADLGNGRGINIPAPISEAITNIDKIIGKLGLAYGISNRWEIGVNTAGFWQQSRFQIDNNLQNQTSINWQDINLTTQFQLIKNHENLPDSLLFAEISTFDRTKGLNQQFFSSFLLGTTIYHTNDPIAFGLTGAYLWQRNRTINDKTISLGNALNLSANAGFAVNPDITLTTGINWQYKKVIRLSIKQKKFRAVKPI